MRNRLFLTLALLAVAVLMMPQWAAAQGRAAKGPTADGFCADLGTLGGHSSLANDINAKGQVVGWAMTPDWQHHPFLWTQKEGMQDLGGFGEANAINERGDVVGASQTEPGTSVKHAFLWTAKDGMRDLLPQAAWSEALDINNQGQVVGDFRTTETSRTRAFLWDPQKGLQELPTLGGDGDTIARAINDRGQVAGSSVAQISGIIPQRAFLWDPRTGIRDLGTLGASNSGALGINNRGQVVGWSGVYNDFVTRAFLWDPAAGMQDLGTQGRAGRAADINEAGQAVGSQLQATVDPFEWSASTGLRYLPIDPDFPFAEADAINNRGQIVGQALGPDGGHACLWP